MGDNDGTYNCYEKGSRAGKLVGELYVPNEIMFSGLSHSFWPWAKFSMVSHASSPLNSLRFPSAAKSSTECRGEHCRLSHGSDFVHLSRLHRSKMSFHQALNLIFELDETTREGHGHKRFGLGVKDRCHDEGLFGDVSSSFAKSFSMEDEQGQGSKILHVEIDTAGRRSSELIT
ncbi:hypothetical protein Tco_0277182 [Tanacetum coccineum]